MPAFFFWSSDRIITIYECYIKLLYKNVTKKKNRAIMSDKKKTIPSSTASITVVIILCAHQSEYIIKKAKQNCASYTLHLFFLLIKKGI